MYTEEQIRTNRAEWCKALRSGQFEQTTGYLCESRLDKPNSYCCLGVACEISPVLGIELEVQKEENGPFIYFDGFDMDLPPKMALALGLSKDAQQTLIEMNDTQGATFEEIADFIEILPITDENGDA